MIDKCVAIHQLTSQVYAATAAYRKKFDCKHCSEWFHSKKKIFDKNPAFKGRFTLKCETFGYYNILHKSGKCKWEVDIHRKYTKYEITALCIEKNWVIPIDFYSDEPDSDDSGMG